MWDKQEKIRREKEAHKLHIEKYSKKWINELLDELANNKNTDTTFAFELGDAREMTVISAIMFKNGTNSRIDIYSFYSIDEQLMYLDRIKKAIRGELDLKDFKNDY